MINADRIRDSHCDLAFTRIFWALLVVLIDIRLGGRYRVDILPDFIGWIVIFSALGWMENVHPTVRTIRMLTAAEIFLSFFDLVDRVGPQHSGFQFSIDLSPPAIGSFVSLVVMVIIIWQICGLIMKLAEALDEPVLRARADLRRKLFLALWVAVPIAVLSIIAAPPFGIVLGIGVAAYALVVFILILALMLHAAGACRSARNRRNITTEVFESSPE
jgi:hypothetical protein